MITAPYNFVPLNEEVFYPPWNNEDSKVSHDIPFEDGESGEIDITITAKSPIFIRNNEIDHADENSYYIDKDCNKISKEFCHIKTSDGSKQYYVPGSSMKGMIRNILEIMSFSKIRVDEKKFKNILSVRDMTSLNTLVGKATGKIKNKNFGYGILYLKNDGSYDFEDYGNKIRVILQNELKNHSSREKDVSKKYKKKEPFTKIKVKKQNIQQKKYFDKCPVIKDENGEEGELFFGGHFGKKHYEFVLLPSDIQKDGINIPKKSIDNFKHIYFENESKDNYVGDYWRNKTKIPIFYTKKNDEIDLGLTQLFKLAYKKTLFEASEQNSDESKLDLAETIFGTERDNLALKGRVQFSHLKSNVVKDEDKIEVEQVLGSPQPTYYPNYIRQENINNDKVNKYTTLMNPKAKISGWKRYPIQNKTQEYPLPENNDVITKFKPLGIDTTFKGKVNFHNLKKVEIGALLSALTFHGLGNNYLHNIGMAKPLGYGKVSIKLSNFKYFDKLKEANISEYLEAFNAQMNSLENKDYENWCESNQITNLLAMHNNDEANTLRYQLLENKNPTYYTTNRNGDKKYEKNDFIVAKKEKEYLKLYSKNSDEKKHQNSNTINIVTPIKKTGLRIKNKAKQEQK